jgi:hypothetical protein
MLPCETIAISPYRLDPICPAVSEFGSDILDMGIDNPIVRFEGVIEARFKDQGPGHQIPCVFDEKPQYAPFRCGQRDFLTVECEHMGTIVEDQLGIPYCPKRSVPP